MTILFNSMKMISSLQCVDVGYSEMSTALWTLVRVVLAYNRKLNDFRIAKLILSQNTLDKLCDILPFVRAFHVSLYQCRISEKQASQLCEMCSNNKIMSHFSINGCQFANNHMSASKLFESIHHTRFLKQLHIKEINFIDDEIDHINLASVIAASQGIKSLNFTGCRIPDYEMHRVFDSTRDLDLQSFSLSNMNFSEEICVANALKLKTSLKYMNLFNCNLRNKNALLVCEATKSITNLIYINLSGNNISDVAAKFLADAINNNTFLTHLELESCNLLQDGLWLVCDSIKKRNLKTLNLSCNCITDQIAEDLAHTITSKNCIEILRLKKCSLKCNGIKAVISALETISSVTFLDLSYNKMSEMSLCLAAVIDANIHLEKLDLSYCDITEWIKTKPSSLSKLYFNGNRVISTAALSMRNCFGRTYSLSMSKCHLQETQLKHILGSVKNSLQYLDLSFNTISDEVARLLAEALCDNIELQHLNLSHCRLNENGLSFILKAVTSRIINYIDLSFNPINDMLASGLAKLISVNRTLKHLSLSSCALQEQGFISLADALTNSNLIWLDISSNCITKRVVSELNLCRIFLKRSQLECLNLKNCQWQENSLQIMLNEVTNNVKSLKCINLSGCEMNYKEVKILNTLIMSIYTIEQLILDKCLLTPARIECMFHALKQLKTIKHLNLSNNKIPEKAISILVEFMPRNKIERLELSHCSLGTNCSALLLEIAKFVTLKYLDLSYNDISDDEASCVASAITNNEYFCHLNLTNNQFSCRGIKIILNAMARINSLQSVNLGSYSITSELVDDVIAVTISNPKLKIKVACTSGIPQATLQKVICTVKFHTVN